MPVLVDRGPGGCSILVGKEPAGERLQARRHPAGSEWIEVGLVNNMPEAALEATEQQFLDLLGAAAGDSWVHLRFFSLPEVPRSERGRSYLSRSYGDVADIRSAALDLADNRDRGDSGRAWTENAAPCLGLRVERREAHDITMLHEEGDDLGQLIEVFVADCGVEEHREGQAAGPLDIRPAQRIELAFGCNNLCALA